MSILTDVQTFIDESRKTQTMDDLYNLVQAISCEMSFDYFALVHHADLRLIRPMASQFVADDFIILGNYPHSWTDRYVSEGIIAIDPVLMASQATSVAFAWDSIPELIRLTVSQRNYLEQTRRAWLGDGFTIPANIPGQSYGSCSFAVAAGRDVPMEHFAMAQSVGVFAFEAARKLVRREQGIPHFEPVRLTHRQLECIVLVARGKTDWEIGKILGISEETVKQHLKDARERYDVPKRVQVIIRALFDCQISLADLIS